MPCRHLAVALALALGCSAERPAADARADASAEAPDAPVVVTLDAPGPTSDAPPPDAPIAESLSEHRERLVATLGAPCATWAALDASQRAVFLTITHRLFLSRTPDGASMLSHVDGVHAVLGGGSSGTTCGGSDNNRLFLSTDEPLHGWLIETWADGTPIADGAGATWIHTRDAAGPHDPFDASAETDTGLRCTLLFETSGSRPPTAQAHYFEGAPVAFDRGTASLPADPYMLEIDQDFNCIHDSNPTCHDFEDRYRTNHGDFECGWIPAACTSTDTGCYRDPL